MQNLKIAKIGKKRFEIRQKSEKNEKTSKREAKNFRRKFLKFSKKISHRKYWADAKAEFEEFGLQRERRRALSSLPKRQFFAKRKIREKSSIFRRKIRRIFDPREAGRRSYPVTCLNFKNRQKKFNKYAKRPQKSAKRAYAKGKNAATRRKAARKVKTTHKMSLDQSRIPRKLEIFAKDLVFF